MSKSEDKHKKRGRFGIEEDRYLIENHTGKTIYELSDYLNREPKTIKRRIIALGLTSDDAGNMTYEVGFELEARHYYKGLQKQFDKDQMETFKAEWCHIMSQFNNDVLHTEEMQIVESIKYGIMMDSCLEEQYKYNEEITSAQAELAELERVAQPTPDDNMEMDILLKQIGDAQASRDTTMSNYVKFQKEKNTLFQKIKGTRDDRVKNIENRTATFGSYIADLVTNKQKRKDLGEFLEKNRLSRIDEEIRLSAYHKYEDGMIDQVLLTPDTVKEDHVE